MRIYDQKRLARLCNKAIHERNQEKIRKLLDEILETSGRTSEQANGKGTGTHSKKRNEITAEVCGGTYFPITAAAGSDGRRNTLQRVDSIMLSRENRSV
jgi:hypothetical protein